MALHVQWSDEELPALKELLLRALNTWDPKLVPPWALQLDSKVEARLLQLRQSENVDDRT